MMALPARLRLASAVTVPTSSLVVKAWKRDIDSNLICPSAIKKGTKFKDPLASHASCDVAESCAEYSEQHPKYRLGGGDPVRLHPGSRQLYWIVVRASSLMVAMARFAAQITSGDPC
jgi:hypothetical protein